ASCSKGDPVEISRRTALLRFRQGRAHDVADFFRPALQCGPGVDARLALMGEVDGLSLRIHRHEGIGEAAGMRRAAAAVNHPARAYLRRATDAEAGDDFFQSVAKQFAAGVQDSR